MCNSALSTVTFVTSRQESPSEKIELKRHGLFVVVLFLFLFFCFLFFVVVVVVGCLFVFFFWGGGLHCVLVFT